MGNRLSAHSNDKCRSTRILSWSRKFRMGNGSSHSNSQWNTSSLKKKGHHLSGAVDNSGGYAGANYYPGEGVITAERLHNPSLSPDLHRLHTESSFPLPLNQCFGGINGGTVQRPRTARAPKRSSGQDPCVGSLTDEFRSPITNSASNPKHSVSTPKQFSTGIYQQRRSASTTTLLVGTPWEQRFVALHDYTARVEDDLSMTKGQQFCIIDRSQGYWWYAKCISTGLMGYVPYNYLAPVTSLESNEWYFGDMRRLQAEQCLLMHGNDQGSFLVRASESRSGEYSLSVRDGETVKHYRIRSRVSRSNTDICRYYISRQLPFVSLQQLVEHYMKNQSGLCCQLTAVCLRPSQPVPVGLSHNLVDKWEISKSSIVLKERIGKGQFGEVYRAVWNGTTLVAVKTLRANCCNVEDFLLEAQTMKRLHHPHLIQLYAVCTQSAPFYLVTELMSKGSLLSFLQSSEGRGLSMRALIMIAVQIASGMAYLESQHYIHRDLAARNVLVGDADIVKIADFGLARMIQNKEYVAHAGARFPIKWTAPEAANYSRFTVKSDVWSFGILLTEIVTHGRTPYPGMHNAEVLRQVEAGYRMPAPNGCPPALYDLMLECWAAEEDARPAFAQIHTRLELLLCDEEAGGLDEDGMERPAYRDPDPGGLRLTAVAPDKACDSPTLGHFRQVDGHIAALSVSP